MSKATIVGNLIGKSPIKKFGNDIEMREIIVKTKGEYSQEIAIGFWKDNISKLEPFGKDALVEVQCDIRGRKVEKDGEEPRWYTSLAGWSIREYVADAPTKEAPENQDSF